MMGDSTYRDVAAALAAELEGRGEPAPWDADTLAAALLRACRAAAPAVESQVSRLDAAGHGPRLLDDRERMAGGVRDILAIPRADGDDLVRLVDLLRPTLAWVGRALRVPVGQAAPTGLWLLARAIDDVWGASFPRLFARRGRWQLRDGDPVPRCQAALPELFAGASLTARPDVLERPVARTRRLALGPPAGAPQFALSFALYDELPAPHAGARMAVGAPVTAAECGRGAPPSYFPVRPPDDDARAAATVELVQRAAADGAQLVMLPELTVGERTLAAIVAWMKGRAPGSLAVLAGSRHTDRDGAPRNVATLVLAGGRCVEHVKLNEFYDREAREGIATGELATIYAVAGDGRFAWSYALAVCKDFLAPGYRQGLLALAPGSVLIAAMSASTDAEHFRARATALTLDTQCVTVFASCCTDRPHTEGFVTAPLKGRNIVEFRIETVPGVELVAYADLATVAQQLQ